MRYAMMAVWLVLSSVASAATQVSVGISLPGISIGINLPAYPELVQVPGYPVYYAPRLEANYFFYDGMYWAYAEDNWYASYWYNGPWDVVYPQYVPVFVLRIPVYYYRRPPVYFRAWRRDAPPRWGQHWGRDWEQQHRGWDTWDRRAAPAPAPLPVYQREYTGSRYPQPEQQPVLHKQHYNYQPREAVVRERYQRMEQQRPSPAQQGEQRRQEQQREVQPQRDMQQREIQQQRNMQRENPSSQRQQGVPAGSRSPSPQMRGEEMPGTVSPVPDRNRTPGAQGQGQGQRQVPQQEVVQPQGKGQVQGEDSKAQQRYSQPKGQVQGDDGKAPQQQKRKKNNGYDEEDSGNPRGENRGRNY